MSKRFEGYHDENELPVKKGDTVTIVKGTTIRTMLPSMNGGYKTKVAGRTYKVKVDHILNGMNRPVGQKNHNASYPVQSPSVRWPGTGGYWFQVDLNDIPEAQVPPTRYVLNSVDDERITMTPTELEGFLGLNYDANFDQETIQEIKDLRPGQVYRGGGGAAPEWSLEAHK